MCYDIQKVLANHIQLFLVNTLLFYSPLELGILHGAYLTWILAIKWSSVDLALKAVL